MDRRMTQTRLGKKYERQDAKPPYTYMGMMIAAIWYSATRSLSLSEILQRLEEMFSFFKESPYKGWKDSVRHTLSHQACFVKVLKDPARRHLKGNLWTVDMSQVPPRVFNLQRTVPSAKCGNYPEYLLEYLNLPPLLGDAEQTAFKSAVSLYSISAEIGTDEDAKRPKVSSEKSKEASTCQEVRMCQTDLMDANHNTDVNTPRYIPRASTPKYDNRSDSTLQTGETLNKTDTSPLLLPSSFLNTSVLSPEVKELLAYVCEDYLDQYHCHPESASSGTISSGQYSYSDSKLHELGWNSDEMSSQVSYSTRQSNQKIPQSRRKLFCDDDSGIEPNPKWFIPSELLTDAHIQCETSLAVKNEISDTSSLPSILDALAPVPNSTKTTEEWPTTRSNPRAAVHGTSLDTQSTTEDNRPNAVMHENAVQANATVPDFTSLHSAVNEPVLDRNTVSFSHIPWWNEAGEVLDAHQLIPVDCELPNLSDSDIFNYL